MQKQLYESNWVLKQEIKEIFKNIKQCDWLFFSHFGNSYFHMLTCYVCLKNVCLNLLKFKIQ